MSGLVRVAFRYMLWLQYGVMWPIGKCQVFCGMVWLHVALCYSVRCASGFYDLQSAGGMPVCVLWALMPARLSIYVVFADLEIEMIKIVVFFNGVVLSLGLLIKRNALDLSKFRT